MWSESFTYVWTDDSYLQFMHERLIIMRWLLSEQGSIYVQCDWHKSHQIRMLLDEIFEMEIRNKSKKSID